MSDLIRREDAIALVIKAMVETDNEEIQNYLFDGLRRQMWSLPSAEASQNLAEPNKKLKGSDLIRREDAIKAIEELTNAYNGWSDAYDKAYIIGVLEEVPSAEPKTGEWKLDPNGMDWNIPAWRCSECGFVATHIGVEPNGLGNNPMNWAGSKFCPQCGARITGYER